MRKDNPAVYQCKKGRAKIHAWQARPDGTAICVQCKLVLSPEDAADCLDTRHSVVISRTVTL